MVYKFCQGKVFTNSIEYSVAYHCNLQCTHCSHLSPFVDASFPSLNSFSEDLLCLSEIIHAKVIRLLGGEPLLNPDIDSFIAIAKKSSIADSVMVTTNGLLLHRMSDSFWENVDYVLVSLYPNISLKENYRVLKQRAKDHNTRLWFQIINNFHKTITASPHKNNWITSLIYKSCRDVHFFHCHMIHEGMLYKCAVPPFLPYYLSKLNIPYNPYQDGFAIHSHLKPYDELREYLTDMRPKESCRYCLGSVGEKIPHSQLLSLSPSGSETTSRTLANNIDCTRLIKEGCSYFYRRLMEQLTKKESW
jgi:organic radical activating enzyme